MIMSIFHKLKNKELMENINEIADLEINFTPDKKILGGAYLTFYGEMEGSGVLIEKTPLTKVSHKVLHLRCGGRLYKVVCLNQSPNIDKGMFVEMTAEIKDIRVKVPRKADSKKKNESRIVRRYIYKTHKTIDIAFNK